MTRRPEPAMLWPVWRSMAPLAVLLVACSTSAPVTAPPSPAASTSGAASATPAATPITNATGDPTAAPRPSLARGTAPLPALQPDPAFAGLAIALAADDPLGTVGA